MVETAVRSGFGAPSAPAQRNRKARWKDGRLVLGVLLVAVTALAGAKLLSSADDTTTIWAAKHDLKVGVPLTDDDLTTVRVRFTSTNDSERYLAADADVKGLVAGRAIDQGEFLPKDAAVAKSDQDRTELPLSVATGHLPSDTAVGDIVDVWVVPKEEGQPARPLWSSVRVLQIDSVKGVAGSSARRQVLIGLTSADLSRIPAALTAMRAGEPTLVRKAG
ncbi:SAF domain-containing protein [Kribbella sp. NBC_00709]|uniref:SAF domain-containing protein n=1 Tax=Kribbella sp. NBC_00709 TaxID=2975972 RepID=UPI002E29FF38|nr:SAF domain-containing protein [Kribbella sp. NBC_00709]